MTSALTFIQEGREETPGRLALGLEQELDQLRRMTVAHWRRNVLAPETWFEWILEEGEPLPPLKIMWRDVRVELFAETPEEAAAGADDLEEEREEGEGGLAAL